MWVITQAGAGRRSRWAARREKNRVENRPIPRPASESAAGGFIGSVMLVGAV